MEIDDFKEKIKNKIGFENFEKFCYIKFVVLI